MPSSSWQSRSWTALISAALLALQMLLPVNAITLDIDNEASIKNAAKIAAQGMVSYYTGYRPGDVPGNLPPPYYWWEAGAMFGALIDYWYYTGDDTWNNITIQALLWQASPTANFMPPNQTKTEGNDDQGFWGIAAMAAAERNFPNPPPNEPQWLALVQGTFNSQAVRWDSQTCGGGLKWQIYPFNNGYDYKNTISNGCFFNMAARLARYTGNASYADWAVKTWDWMTASGLMGSGFEFYDGADDRANCSVINRIQWTYNAGVFLHGAANMYNYTNGSDLWRGRVQGILDATHVFFYNDTDIMFEVACETLGNCLVDQHSFKAYLSRWFAATTQLAPFTTDFIMKKLRASALAAANACTGGQNGRTCGQKWTTGSFDNSVGVGEQMSAMEVFQSNLIAKMPPPVTETVGGTSKGDPGAGLKGTNTEPELNMRIITKADRAGAGILTILFLAGVLGVQYWMSTD